MGSILSERKIDSRSTNPYLKWLHITSSTILSSKRHRSPYPPHTNDDASKMSTGVPKPNA